MTIQEQIQQLQQDIKNANELFNAQLKALEEQLKKEQESKVYVPKIGEVYFTISWGRTEAFETQWVNNAYDYNALKMGNVFQTKEECEWEIQHSIVATELKNYVAENDPRPITEKDWGDTSKQIYSLVFDYNSKTVSWIWTDRYKDANVVYSSSTVVLAKAIEHIGEDKLKKYYFGVGE